MYAKQRNNMLAGCKKLLQYGLKKTAIFFYSHHKYFSAGVNACTIWVIKNLKYFSELSVGMN